MAVRCSVQLFAIARERVGKSTVELELSHPATVGSLRAQLATQYPVLADILPAVRFAVDADYANDESVIQAQAEVALIPPVSGG